MSSVLFDVQVDPTDLLEVLERKGRATEVLAPTFAIVAEDFVAAVVDRIDSQGDGAWPPNAPSTIDQKGSAAPMIDTGQLRSSIRAESGKDWAMASTSTAYIVFHLDGGDLIPRRNPFDIGEQHWEDAAQLIADAVAAA